ncbi:phosphatase PAP2 family protein [Cuneatibacter caecimuris]|uniref:Undecaprenyl-diphosphatase n=1 Tax=Cuneatibacter caecimuris TaxID=1796618 RepID=A0A4V2F5H0_9FIRM|nr:phosphatase PAP2 family protein [Cuneatibacter caecimuris]RZS92789.1 undecaprenyl-diphosphatase [Cuneatibacter caecimuris]
MTAFEIGILEGLQKIHNPVLDQIMVMITSLGNAGIFWILTAILLLCIPKTRKYGCCMAATLVVHLLICNLGLKPLVHRTRPYEISGFTGLIVARPVDFSFPSGHTMVSFACAPVIWYMNRRLGIAAFILAALIGFSRLYLYVHFPTDVLCGMVLGLAVGFLVMNMFGKWILSKGGKRDVSGGDL